MRSGRRWLARLAQLAVLAVVGWALFRAVGVQLGELRAAELDRWRPGLFPLGLSAVVLLGVYVAHGLLWRRILADLGVASPPVATALRVYFLASLGRYLPGRLWQVAGLAYLARRAGIPAAEAAACAVLGQAAFLVTGAAFAAASLPGWGGRVGALVAGAVIAGAAGVVVVLGAAGPGRSVRAWLARRLPKAEAVLELAGRVGPRHALIWSAAYLGTWLAVGAAFALFATAFVPEAARSPVRLAGAVAAAYLGGYIAVFAPAGLVVREGLLWVLLAELVPAPAALVIALASRLWFTAVELVPVAGVALLGSRGAARPVPGEGSAP